uniref:G-protein coupled receptors family 1 profile domain-containing protein n=1 Tax=Ciona savignyi TaxID=51511 RepID=H2Y8S1_CIOSA
LSFVTTAGNILVIVAFHANRRLQTITNYFILSLAYADMVIGLVSMNLFTIYIVQGEWRLGPLVCDIWLCIDYVASNASVMNLLIISVDRYLALTKPLTYRAKRTKRRACLMIVGAWMVSFVLWVPSILLWPLVEGGRNVHNKKCSIRFIVASPAVAIGTAMAAFYVPVLVMSALSWCIHRVNIEHNKYANTFRIQDKPSERNARRYLWTSKFRGIPLHNRTKLMAQFNLLPKNRRRVSQNVRSFSARENKAARMLLCIMIVFIITWAPYNILVVISTICGEDGCVNDVLWKLSYWLCYINSTINPACYALCSPEFRNTFLRILRCQK